MNKLLKYFILIIFLISSCISNSSKTKDVKLDIEKIKIKWTTDKKLTYSEFIYLNNFIKENRFNLTSIRDLLGKEDKIENIEDEKLIKLIKKDCTANKLYQITYYFIYDEKLYSKSNWFYFYILYFDDKENFVDASYHD